MAEYGVEPEIDFAGDVVYDTNKVTTPELSAMDIADDCTTRVNESGLVDTATPTEDQLRTTHQELTEWANCLQDRGVDMGNIISVEEFVGRGGEVWPYPDAQDPVAGLSLEAQDEIEVACPTP